MGSGGAGPPQAGEWCVLWGMCALCLLCHPVGSMSPLLGHWTQTGYGVTPPWPPSFGSVATLVPPPPLLSWGSWGGSPAWLRLPSWLPLVLRSSPWPVHSFSLTGTLGPAWGLILDWVFGKCGRRSPSQGPSGGGSRGFNWFHLG